MVLTSILILLLVWIDYYMVNLRRISSLAVTVTTSLIWNLSSPVSSSRIPAVARTRSLLRMSSTSANTSRTPRVLSIQSHTVHGFVGNKAATFPLQSMGFDVDCINTVSLSNHPAYSKGCKGQSLDADTFSSMIDGLDVNDLLNYDIVITGYTRSSQHLETTRQAIERIRQINPNAIYLCDPVLGDHGSYYVPPELMEEYKQKLLPLSTMITPNFFECEVLSGIKINTFDDAIKACEKLHELGPEIVVMTGLNLLPNKFLTPHLAALMSYKEKHKLSESGTVGEHQMVQPRHWIYRVDIPKIDRNFAGCGDLFSAFHAAGLYQIRDLYRNSHETPAKAPHVLGDILEISAKAMSEVLSLTFHRESRELSIIESQKIFIQAAEEYANIRTKRSLVAVPSVKADGPLSASPQHNAYLAHSNSSPSVLGVIFDMDGTLTHPGAIDFKAMYTRTGLKKRRPSDDILSLIAGLSSDEEKEKALQIVYEEEMKGCDKQSLRPDLHSVLYRIKEHGKVRIALCTRNCEEAYLKFLDKASFESTLFSPALWRDAIGGGINKPDPALAKHIMNEWNILSGQEGKVWFVGDSLDDMQCGRSAGCQTCLIVTNENEKVRNEHSHLVDHVVHSLEELAVLLGLPAPTSSD